MIKKNRFFSMKSAMAAIIIAVIATLLFTNSTFATDAMKPGHGHGDANHTHYGPPPWQR